MKLIKTVQLLILCSICINTTYCQIKYTGKLGDYPIALTIEHPIEQAQKPAYFLEHKEILANYFYTKYKKDIRLKGTWDEGRNLFLVEQSADQLAIFEFPDYDPTKKNITGVWKSEKKGKEILYPVTLTLKSVTEPIVRKQKPITYQGEL